MAQELLAVKLGEMDQKIGKLHGRIESSCQNAPGRD